MHRQLQLSLLLGLSSLIGGCVESEYEEDFEVLDTETDASLDEDIEEDDLAAESRPSELPPVDEPLEPPSPGCPTTADPRCLQAGKCFIYSIYGTDSLPGVPQSRGWNGVKGNGTTRPEPNFCYATNKAPSDPGYAIAPCDNVHALCGPICY